MLVPPQLHGQEYLYDIYSGDAPNKQKHIHRPIEPANKQSKPQKTHTRKQRSSKALYCATIRNRYTCCINSHHFNRCIIPPNKAVCFHSRLTLDLFNTMTDVFTWLLLFCLVQWQDADWKVRVHTRLAQTVLEMTCEGNRENKQKMKANCLKVLVKHSLLDHVKFWQHLLVCIVLVLYFFFAITERSEQRRRRQLQEKVRINIVKL